MFVEHVVFFVVDVALKRTNQILAAWSTHSKKNMLNTFESIQKPTDVPAGGPPTPTKAEFIT